MHISWGCSHLNTQKLKVIEGTKDLIPEAAAGMMVDPEFWLRGLPSMDLPDPLNMENILMMPDFDAVASGLSR